MAQFAKPRNRSSLRSRPARGTSTQTRMKRTSLPGRRRRRNGSGGLRRCSSYANRIACRQGFRGIIDNPVGGRQARNDLHTVTEIAAQSHVLEDDLVVAVEGGDLCALIPSYQRSGRNCYQISRGCSPTALIKEQPLKSLLPPFENVGVVCHDGFPPSFQRIGVNLRLCMSVSGTFRTWRDVLVESAFGCKAEVGLWGCQGS